jgi:hypothetical protein
MKLLLQLYHAAAGGASSTPLAERCAGAGGVPGELVAAFRAVLEDGQLDGSFKVGEEGLRYVVMRVLIVVCSHALRAKGGCNGVHQQLRCMEHP